MNHARLWILCIASALLCACGSSDDGAAPMAPVAASDAIPDAVSQGVAGMVSWISQLAAEDT
jgi:hypothetical protein